MIYLGIDIAKNSHVASAISADGEILISPFLFSNDISGFSLLIETIKPFAADQLLIGMESTAHYAENLIFFLFNRGYKVVVINPLQTAALRRSSIRKTKTDKVDSFLIAQALILYSYTPLQQWDVHTLTLRGLCKTRQNLILMRTRYKIQLGAFVDQLFPELNRFFRSGLHINTSYQLLKRHPRPCEIKNLHLTYLSNLLSKASRGRFTKQDAVRLRKFAAVSVGIDSPILSLQIRQAIHQIELFTQQITQVDSSIIAAMERIDSPIMTIPGIGYINGAMILSSIGDVSRFPDPSKLLAYAGLDPAVIQSGNFNARSTRMSKRGSSLLRYALINAAHNVAKNNVTFGDYYAAKIAQGKSHYSALGHTAHKLVRIIFVLLTRKVAFELP